MARSTPVAVRDGLVDRPRYQVTGPCWPIGGHRGPAGSLSGHLSGTRVASAAPRPSAREREARLASLTATYVLRARALGATDAEIAGAVLAQSP